MIVTGCHDEMDGYAWHRPANPLLTKEDGFYDLAFGFKYAAIDNREKNFRSGWQHIKKELML